MPKKAIKKEEKIEEKKVKKDLSTFRKDFRKTVSTAIITAFGLVIALSWNSLISDLVKKISSYSPLGGQLITTLIVTVICVLGIYLTGKILSPKKE